MWATQCHKPIMTGTGNHTISIKMLNLGMVYYCLTNIISIRFLMVICFNGTIPKPNLSKWRFKILSQWFFYGYVIIPEMGWHEVTYWLITGRGLHLSIWENRRTGTHWGTNRISIVSPKKNINDSKSAVVLGTMNGDDGNSWEFK